MAVLMLRLRRRSPHHTALRGWPCSRMTRRKVTTLLHECTEIGNDQRCVVCVQQQ